VHVCVCVYVYAYALLITLIVATSTGLFFVLRISELHLLSVPSNALYGSSVSDWMRMSSAVRAVSTVSAACGKWTETTPVRANYLTLILLFYYLS
jgi:hypothetical protein